MLCVDCHVLFVPGSLRKLLDYFEANPDTPDLLQGPLVYDDLRSFSTHMDRIWQAGMYGVWGTDPILPEDRGLDGRSFAAAVAVEGSVRSQEAHQLVQVALVGGGEK